MPQRTTFAFVVICEGETLLFKSKSDRAEINQFDPECCSRPFASEQERLKFLKEQYFPTQMFSKKTLKENVFLHVNPIKFDNNDSLGQKFLSAYVLEVKHKNFLGFLLQKDRRETMWVSLEKIQNKTAEVYITEMFYKLFNEVPRTVKLNWSKVQSAELA